MNTYRFKAPIWKYKGPAGWTFVTVPKNISSKIRKKSGFDEEGWGRLKAVAQIGKTEWTTAIWFDTKVGSYLLPVKADVRKKEKITNDLIVSVSLKIPSSNFKFSSFRKDV